MKRLAWALALWVAGCGGEPPSPGVLVERLPDGDWRATWQAAEPIRLLRFERPAYWLREREWRVVTPGYAFSRDADDQVLRLRAGARAADTVSVEFPVNTAFLPRDYELFHVFSDGSAALYTGHFIAAVNERPARLANVTVAGAHTLADAHPGTDGTVAYVGGIDAVEHDRVIALIDPGLPRWLATTLAQRLPELFAFFAARTGHALETRPVVLFSFVPGAGDDITGGVVGNAVLLRASGDRWREDDPWAVRTALRLIAHEAAHLWNSGLASFRAGAPPWLHEGGAEAFADEALHGLGVLDDAGLRTAYSRALAECADGARREYSCGEVAAWWTDLAVRAARPGADLFAVWGALAARAGAGDGYYGPDEYFAALAAFGVPDAAAASLRRFTANPGRETLPALLEVADEICNRADVAGLGPRCLRTGPENPARTGHR